MNTVAVGNVLCEMDSTALRLFEKLVAERDALRAALQSLVDGKSEFDIEYDTGMPAGEARRIIDLAYNRK